MQVYEYGDPDSPVVLIEPIHVPEGMEQEASLIREKAGRGFHMLAVRVDWFRDLSPWPAPAVYGDIPFGSGAEETLAGILTLTGNPGKQYILGGYSMGGLFALWAACRTDAFSAVAAASPSVWFPGFAEYMAAGTVRAKRVYLSLEQADGDAVITFRNTSREPLDAVNTEELVERFTRGDASRNTEGSGLGLAIAKSLTELQGGKFLVSADGDLFKVILRFPKI